MLQTRAKQEMLLPFGQRRNLSFQISTRSIGDPIDLLALLLVRPA